MGKTLLLGNRNEKSLNFTFCPATKNGNYGADDFNLIHHTGICT